MFASGHLHLIVGDPLVTLHGLSGVIFLDKLNDGVTTSNFNKLLVQALHDVHL